MRIFKMKMLTLIASLMLSSAVVAQPVYLNIPAEHTGAPAMTIPTASHDSCEDLMVKLSKEDNQNFYMSCSIVPMEK